MTDRIEEICATLNLSRVEVEHWIAVGWARADGSDPDWARLRLLADLRGDMGIERDTVGVILSLIDQVHDLRSRLRRVGEAVSRQPASVQREIIDAMTDD